MHHNTVRRNILVPPGTEAKAILYRNVSFADNACECNLFWQAGRRVRTGQCAVQGVTGPNLVANGGFEDGDAEGLPPGWTCRPPIPAAKAEPVTEMVHEGKRALRLLAVAPPTFEGKPPWERQVMLESARVRTAVPGRVYRLSVWLKSAAEGVRVTVEALCY
jgi:hypothetical protein